MKGVDVMEHEKETKKLMYEKAAAEIIHFDNSDVITTSGSSGGGCETWSNMNGQSCHYGLTVS